MNSAKVEITATYKDETADGTKQTQANIASISATEKTAFSDRQKARDEYNRAVAFSQTKESEGYKKMAAERGDILRQIETMEAKGSGDRIRIIDTEFAHRSAKLAADVEATTLSETEKAALIARGHSAMEAARGQEVAGTGVLASAVGRLATVYGAMYAARTLVRWGEEAVQMAILSAEAQRTAVVFGRLAEASGGSAVKSMEDLRRATQDTISDFELMQRVGAAVDAGLTFQQAQTAVEYVKARTDAFAGSFEAKIQAVMLALETGVPRGLKQVGIIIDANSKMFDGLDEAQKKTMLTALALKEMQDKLGVVTTGTDNAVEASERLTASWRNFNVVMGEVYAGPLSKVLDAAANFFKSSNTGFDASPADIAALSSRAPATHGMGSLTEKPLTVSSPDDVIRRLREAGDAKIAAEQIKTRREVLAQIGILEAKSSDDTLALRTAEVNKERDVLMEKVKDWKDASDQIARINAGADADISAAREKQQEERNASLETFIKKMDDLLTAQKTDEAKLTEALAIETEKRAAQEQATNEKRRNAYQELVDAIGVMEGKNSKDALAAGQVKALDDMMKKAADAKLTLEQILVLLDRMQGAQGAETLKAAQEQTVKHVLLFFDANTQNVKTQSDLAAYSIGLLTQQLRGLSPAIAGAIGSMQQIVVGAAQRSATSGFFAPDGSLVGNVTAAGAASIAAGGLSILTAGLNDWSKAEEYARAETERLKQSLLDLANAQGDYRKRTESESDAQRRQDFENIANSLKSFKSITGQTVEFLSVFNSIDLKNDTVDLKAAAEALNALVAGQKILGGNQVAQAQEALKQLQVLSDTINGLGGSFGAVIAKVNHEIVMMDVEDPAAKLKMFTDALAGVDKAFLTTSDIYQMEELIHNLEKDKAAAEMKSRQDQADLLIQGIQDKSSEVKRALQDALDSEKQASLRSVGLQFDLQESAIRASYQSRLLGTRGDPLATAAVLSSMSGAIAGLRGEEQGAGIAELAKLNAKYDLIGTAANQNTTDQIAAINAAAKDTTTAFDLALSRELAKVGTSIDAAKAATANLDIAGIIATIDRAHVDATNAASAQLALGPSVINVGGPTVNVSVDVGGVTSRLDTVNTNLSGMNQNIARSADFIEATYLLDTALARGAFSDSFSGRLWSALTGRGDSLLTPLPAANPALSTAQSGFGGSGVNYNQTVNVNGPVMDTTYFQRLYSDTLKQLITNDLKPGGDLWRAIQGTDTTKPRQPLI